MCLKISENVERRAYNIDQHDSWTLRISCQDEEALKDSGGNERLNSTIMMTLDDEIRKMRRDSELGYCLFPKESESLVDLSSSHGGKSFRLSSAKSCSLSSQYWRDG